MIQTWKLLGEKDPKTVDVVFIESYTDRVTEALHNISTVVYKDKVGVYNSTKSRDVLAEYAKIHWKFNGTCSAGD